MYFLFQDQNKETHNIPFEQGESLLSALRRSKVSIKADCSGAGTCGKCKVFIASADMPSEIDKLHLSVDELKRGVRLACKTNAKEGLFVSLVDTGDIQTAFSSERLVDFKSKASTPIAVADIGTTTVTLMLCDKNTGGIIDRLTENNKQASYGADVISRIKSSKTDNNAQHRAITEQISSMIYSLMAKNEISNINTLYVSGNTAMLHLFFGEDCTRLGEYPYIPAFLEAQHKTGKFLGLPEKTVVISLPCMDSFVGADITAGVLSEITDSENYTLLIDLGTNAEIALFNKEECYVTSAAAGPAFEGSKIKQGMAAIPGAICNFSLENGNISLKTVGNASPRGICGSGLIDITAELLKNRLIDETGRLVSDSFELDDEVRVFSEDIRELQLAKAAICTALILLIKHAGIKQERIERVLLSGGFGSYINSNNAAKIGLFPKELAKKAKSVGNSALTGTVFYAVNESSRAIADKIAKTAQVLDLATHPDFSDIYMENIMFG